MGYNLRSKPSGIVSFACPQCQKRFTQRHALQQHTEAKHGDSVTGRGVENPNNRPTEEATLQATPRWSKIPAHERVDLFRLLAKECLSHDEFPRTYRLREFSEEEIEGYGRCRRCNGRKQDVEGVKTCLYHTGNLPSYNRTRSGAAQGDDSKPVYTCCNKNDKGCITSRTHDFAPTNPALAARLGKFEITPMAQNYKTPKRAAIALDCEMVGTIQGDYPVTLSAVDYFTGEVLIDTLINPNVRVINWRSRITGVNPARMAHAVARGLTLPSWEAARAALWEHMDPETILIGQSLNNDLNALGMVHTRVVDSEILTKKAVGPECSRSWGLKNLCETFLRFKIQSGQNGHSSLEDAFAAREVVLWCTRNPEKLAAWAREQRMILEEERAGILMAREDARLQKEQKEYAKNFPKAKVDTKIMVADEPSGDHGELQKLVVRKRSRSRPRSGMNMDKVIIEISESEDDEEDLDGDSHW